MSTSFLPPIDPFATTSLTQQVLQSIPVERNYDVKHHHQSTTTTGYNTAQNNANNQQVPASLNNDNKHHDVDTAKYRNTFLHNVCIEMLQEGFHVAFRELFNLIESTTRNSEDDDDNNNHHHHSEGESAFQDSPEKLVYVKDQLITVEIAERQGQAVRIYEAQYALSQYFEELGNFRLAHHFYLEMFQTSKQVRGDGRKKEAIANYNLGKSAERKKDYVLAQQYYQEYYTLTENKSWKHEEEEDGGSYLHDHACKCLTLVLIKLSDEIEPAEKVIVLDYLHKAYDLMKESTTSDSSITNVGYLLGRKYDCYGDHEKAVHYLTEYLDSCTKNGDTVGMGKAYQALSSAHQTQGNMSEATECLKIFINMMEKCGDKCLLQEACNDLGTLYNYVGNYIESSKYLKQSFELARCKSSSEVEVEMSRCEFGIVQAHGLFGSEVDSIKSNSKENTTKLLTWKSERLQLLMFE